MKYDIRDIMTCNPTWISGTASIEEAMSLINSTGLSHLLIRENGNLSGVISKEDLLQKLHQLANSTSGKSYSQLQIQNTRINEVVSRKPITITQKTTLLEAIEILLVNKIHCLPVLDEENDIKGILTPSDILLAFYKDTK